MTAAEIAHALGAKRAGRDQWMARCPAHADRTPSLSIREGNTGTLVRCHAGCQQRDVIDALAQRGLWERRSGPPPQPPRSRTPGRRLDDVAADQRRRDFVSQIWRESHDPRATPAERYLEGRGLDLDDDVAGRVLRFHPACPFGEGRRVPALLAGFRPISNDPGDDAPPVAILRVGLDERAGKIGKKMLGPVAGGAIKLDADENVTHGLGVAEGLETALAVRAAGWRPVWCLGSAGAIKTLPVLSGIEAISIFADHDENGTGTAAATECAHRWAAAGREAFIRTPRQIGADWLDMS